MKVANKPTLLSVANKPISQSIVLLNVLYAECSYAECRCAMGGTSIAQWQTT
jgi:hypothetical protein